MPTARSATEPASARPDIVVRLAHYGAVGAFVGVVNIGLGLGLSGPLGLPIQVAIPLAFAGAVALHFFLHRSWVWKHTDGFALSIREQLGRYSALASVQYPVTALGTAALPGALGVSDQVAFLIVTVVVAAVVFVVLRTRVFHPMDSRQ